MDNNIKDKLLGMKFGTASHKLRKSLIFSLAKRCNLLTCYRCNKEITSVDEMSIEHKESWLLSSNPKEKFFDLDNIAFSHLKCNLSNITRKTGLNKHGISGYERFGCRCEICKEAKSKKNKKRIR